MGSTVFIVLFALLTVIALAVGLSLRRRAKSASDEVDGSDDAPRAAGERRKSLPIKHQSPSERAMLRSRSRIAFAASAVCGLLTLLVAGSSCLVQVPTKEYGVVTSFGKPVNVLPNGLHLKAPWHKVTDIDAAIQTDSYEQSDKGSTCVQVRIAHQATACVDVSIRWRIKQQATEALFKDYRDFGNIRGSLIVRELRSALNTAMDSYDPLAVDENGVSQAPALAALSQQVQKEMSGTIGDQVEVLSVIIPVMHFDANTQSKVNALLSQVAQTRIAAQSVQTSKQQAQANKTLADSVSKDPNVLVSKCFDLLESGKFTPPAGFSCWPSSGSSVVVPSSAK